MKSIHGFDVHDFCRLLIFSLNYNMHFDEWWVDVRQQTDSPTMLSFFLSRGRLFPEDFDIRQRSLIPSRHSLWLSDRHLIVSDPQLSFL
jgi:hypothetical protein